MKTRSRVVCRNLLCVIVMNLRWKIYKVVDSPESSDRLLCSSKECSLSSRLVPTSWFPLFSLLGINRGVEENLGWPLRKYGRGVSSAKVT